MFGLTRLSIQSKMFLLLLAVSLSSIAVIAVIGYESGRSALMRSVESHLQGVRVAKTTTLKAMLEDLREQVISMSDSRFVIEGMRQFRQAFHALDKTTLDEAQTAALTRFYAEDFLPRLAAQLEATPVLEQYLPTRPAERYLQYHYLAGNPHPTGAKQDLASAAGDPTAYGAVHAKLHKGFARAVEIFGFEDLMLVDADTLDVVYSYEKTTEFGSNLADGPYANSGLSEKLRALRASRDKDDFRLVDFETYRPTPGRPMGFALSPIFDGTELLGFLVLQVNVEQFNKALTGNYNWREEGMGDTGESFVVAADGTMRSRSRFMYEDPQGFLKTLRSTGFSIIYRLIFSVARQEELHATRDAIMTRLWYVVRREGLTIPYPIAMEYAPDESPSRPAPQPSALLNAHPRFRPALREDRAEQVRVMDYAAGETIQHAGQRFEGFALLVHGRAQLLTSGPQGAPAVVGELGPGDCFGGQLRAGSALDEPGVVAIDDVRLMVFEHTAIADLLNQAPGLASELGAAMEQRVKAAQAARQI